MSTRKISAVLSLSLTAAIATATSVWGGERMLSDLALNDTGVTVQQSAPLGRMEQSVLLAPYRQVVDLLDLTTRTRKYSPANSRLGIKEVRTGMYNGHARLVVEFTEKRDATVSLQDSGRRLNITIDASGQNRKASTSASNDPGFSFDRNLSGDRKNTRNYTGKPVSMEFVDAPVQRVFQLLADLSGLNFLIGDDVSGSVTLKLSAVPWDQALDVLLQTKNLAMVRDGNVITIRPKDKLKSQEDEQAAAVKAKERNMELITKVYDISYSALADLQAQFNSVKSERGTISADQRTNRLVVTDIEPAQQRFATIVKQLDTPETQVVIEARIVEMSDSFSNDLGVQWGLHASDTDAKYGISSADGGMGGTVTLSNPAGTFGPGAALGLVFGKLGSKVNVDLQLSAATQTGLAKIISRPSVMTLNNKAAKISQGQQIPYQTFSQAGTQTQFVEAALTLEVTPHIAADGSISMKIKASNNSAGSAPANAVPPINTKEASTEVLIRSGETAVIGGISADSHTQNHTGVPWLMDLPLIGKLFKSDSKGDNKSELVIFITPKIIKQ